MNNATQKPTEDMADWRLQAGPARNRMHSFGLTMIVMGASFMLYYLGVFGTVDGPLTPEKMGAALSGLGVNRRHVIVVLLSILTAAISWNWIFNLTSLIAGSRLTCTAKKKSANRCCGESVKRLRRRSDRSNRTVVEYVCPCGHRRTEAHFHPVKKGVVSHTVWVGCLAFVLIALFCT